MNNNVLNDDRNLDLILPFTKEWNFVSMIHDKQHAYLYEFKQRINTSASL